MNTLRLITPKPIDVSIIDECPPNYQDGINIDFETKDDLFIWLNNNDLTNDGDIWTLYGNYLVRSRKTTLVGYAIGYIDDIEDIHMNQTYVYRRYIK